MRIDAPRIYSLPWTGSGPKTDNFVTTVLLPSKKKIVILCDTYVYCGCKLRTCLMAKRCSGHLFHSVGYHCSLSMIVQRVPFLILRRGVASATRIHKRVSNPRRPRPTDAKGHQASRTAVESNKLFTTHRTHILSSRQLEWSPYAIPARSHRESASPTPSPA